MRVSSLTKFPVLSRLCLHELAHHLFQKLKAVLECVLRTAKIKAIGVFLAMDKEVNMKLPMH